MNLIILGPPGAGKGTESEFLVNERNMIHISTGDIFRTNIEKATPLGKEAKMYADSGKYVPDAVTNEMVKSRLQEVDIATKDFILDGYPRTIQQAEFLANLLVKLNKKIKVIYLEISEQIVIERLSSRRICPSCKTVYNIKFNPPKVFNKCDKDGIILIQRVDDQPEIIQTRLNTYKRETAPLIKYYQDQYLLETIDANLDRKQVKEQINKILAEHEA